MPLADAPLANVLRKGLHQLCRRAEELHPDLVSNAFNTHHDGRAHLHVSSNATGHYGAVPYSLWARTQLGKEKLAVDIRPYAAPLVVLWRSFEGKAEYPAEGSGRQEIPLTPYTPSL
jgi:hypothetical protein